MLVLASSPRRNWLLFPHQLTLSGTICAQPTAEFPPAKPNKLLSSTQAGRKARPAGLPCKMGATAPAHARPQEPEIAASVLLFSSMIPVKQQQRWPFRPPPVAKTIGDTRPQIPTLHGKQTGHELSGGKVTFSSSAAITVSLCSSMFFPR